MTTLLFLDDYHVGDPLFLADLGRRLLTLGPAGRTLIVHRAGEGVERELEGSDPADRKEIIERAIRHVNQGITRRLIEEGVPAVSVQGSDRSLFRHGDELSIGKADWLIQIIETGAVAVISPLATSDSGVDEADPVECAVQVARLVSVRGKVHCAVFCSNRKAGLFKDKIRLETVEVSDLDEYTKTIDHGAAARLAQVADRLVATNSVSLAKGPILEGTQIVTD